MHCSQPVIWKHPSLLTETLKPRLPGEGFGGGGVGVPCSVQKAESVYLDVV